MWMHRKYWTVAGRLQDIGAIFYRCPQLVRVGDVDAKGVCVFMLDMADNLELVDRFCFLGDMLAKSGGADESSKT